MADLKPQIYRGPIPVDDVDFRGIHRRGEADGDHHRTISFPGLKLEQRVPDGDAWLEKCRQLNIAVEPFVAMFGEIAGRVASFLGLGGEGPIKFALRVYDND